nr:hypothetical protein [Tanacetum cinerariifolium]
MFGPSPLSPSSERLQMMGFLLIKKRYKHRLSIQSVFPGLPKTLLIRKKPPAIKKRSKVWVFVNDESHLRLKERGIGPGRAFKDWVGWIIELGAKALVAYHPGVAPRALVYAGLMTSGDARSWYMISDDAKSWVLSVCIYSLSYCTIVQLFEILAQHLADFKSILYGSCIEKSCFWCLFELSSLRIVVLTLIWTPAWVFGFEALIEEAYLKEQILSLMHRFVERFIDRRPKINMLNSLPDQPLIEYGRYALGCMTGMDMKKATYLKMVRDELLRSMEEKRQLIKNYKEM